MSISYPPIPCHSRLTGYDNAQTVGARTTNIVALCPNPNRAADCFCVNNSNKIMYVTFDGSEATTTEGFSIAVPANGGNIDIPSGYTGPINAIWQECATGVAIFHEFSYLEPSTSSTC